MHKINKHLSILKVLSENKLSIHSIINIKTIVSKLLTKYKSNVKENVHEIISLLKSSKQQLPSINRVKMIIEKQLNQIIDFMEMLYSFNTRKQQLISSTVGAIDAHETIGKLPQQFEGMDDNLVENRAWQPAEIGDTIQKARRKNKAPKSK